MMENKNSASSFLYPLGTISNRSMHSDIEGVSFPYMFCSEFKRFIVNTRGLILFIPNCHRSYPMYEFEKVKYH